VDVGCGALVVNSKGYLLGIHERYDTSGKWGVPGGHLDPGEDLLSCAAREASEEAGVACVALGVVAWHECQMPWRRPVTSQGLSDAERGADEHALRWGSTHHGVYVLCYASDDRIKIDAQEVSEARWLSPDVWGSFSPQVASIIAVASNSGQIVAAAAMAASEKGAAASTAKSPPIPHLITASLVPFPSRYGAPHNHVFYFAAPQEMFQKSVVGLGHQSPVPLLPAFGGASVPTPSFLSGGSRGGFRAHSPMFYVSLLGLSLGVGYILGSKPWR